MHVVAGPKFGHPVLSQNILQKDFPVKKKEKKLTVNRLNRVSELRALKELRIKGPSAQSTIFNNNQHYSFHHQF